MCLVDLDLTAPGLRHMLGITESLRPALLDYPVIDPSSGTRAASAGRCAMSALRRFRG